MFVGGEKTACLCTSSTKSHDLCRFLSILWFIHSTYTRDANNQLKRSLYAVFSQYGRILDVVALKTEKLRGQAWVVFSEVTAASNAVRQMQSFPFYDKPMRIQYAKTKSDCFAKADGTYVIGEKKKKQEEKSDRKRKAEDPAEAGPRANGASATAQNNGGST
ncbi:hypothetical protein MKW94_006084, partial [Papaver nudicaule]|nr:hypothetical protein [Papaver nudicaule]